jgi:hypothetical protein
MHRQIHEVRQDGIDGRLDGAGIGRLSSILVTRGCFLKFVRGAARAASRAVAAAAAATGGPEEDGGLNFSAIRRTCINSVRSLDSGSLYPFALMAAGQESLMSGSELWAQKWKSLVAFAALGSMPVG